MLFLASSIIFSVSILILFRYFKKLGINNLQAIIVNYFTAGIIGYCAHHESFTFSTIHQAAWYPLTLVLGFIFIGVFLLFAFSSQQAGVAVTAVASRMSVVIPVIGGFILFGEQAGVFKILGILMVLPALFLTFKKSNSSVLKLSLIALPILLFLGTGTNDLLMKYTDFHYIDADLFLVLATIFSHAMIIGLIVLAFQLFKEQTALEFKNLFGGILLGLLNFGSTYYMFRSMALFDSTVLFPIFNAGVVSIAALSDYLLFGEKLSRTNWIGIALALISIFLISIG